MKVSIRGEECRVIFDFLVDDNDSLVISKSERASYSFPHKSPNMSVQNVGDGHQFFRINETKVVIGVPSDFSLSNTHHDVLALSALLIFLPFIKEKIYLDRPVSRRFHNKILEVLGRQVLPVDDDIEPRLQPYDGKVGMLFSGGVDSSACLELLPDDTTLIYCNRISRASDPKSKSFSSDAAIEAVKFAQSHGYQVVISDNNLEYALAPTAYSTHQAKSVPAILMADHFNLDSLAFGDVLEALYRIGSAPFKDVSNRVNFINLIKLYDVVGLSYFPAAAGLSEVLTQRILRNSVFKQSAVSCVRAKNGVPCGVCIKCFRKSLLERAGDKDFPKRITEMPVKSKLIKKALKENPIKLANTYAYCLQNYEGNSALLALLKEYVMKGARRVDWHERYYPGFLDYIPNKYVDEFKCRLDNFTSPMSKEDILAMKAYGSSGFNGEMHKELVSLLEDNSS